MKLDKFIQTYDSVLTAEQCKNLIEIFERNKDSQESHNTNFYKFNQLNLNTTPGCEILAENFCRSLVKIYEDYFNKLNLRRYIDIAGFEHVRIKKYMKNSSDEFKTHVDITDKESSVRYCIAIAYLNSNNGYTIFPHLNKKIEPLVGRVVVFPPNWMFPHNGKTPTDSNKYIMMTSLHYS